MKMLKKWTLPDSYMGAHWNNYYVFLGQNRDSDSVTRSNFIVGLERLGGESETVIVVRERHWACGWIEWIAIHESDSKALKLAESMLEKIESYPVLSDDHLGNLEWDEACAYWESCSIHERIRLCADNSESIFAARRAYAPDSVMDYLRS